MFNTILVAIDGLQSTDQVMEALDQFRLEPETKVILSHVVSSQGKRILNLIQNMVQWNIDLNQARSS